VPAATARAARLQRTGGLTVAQQQLWALDRLAPTAAAVNLSYALAIDGPLDTGALTGAFGDLIRRHEPLRTTYPAPGGCPVAQVHDEDLALSALRLTAAGAADLAEASRLAREERARGFDLAREAPIRARLLSLGERRRILLLTLHHIAADGWSLDLVSRQLSRFYAARLRHEPAAPADRGEQPQPDSRPVECLEHAAWQQSWLEGPAAEADARWWIDRLRDATPRPPMLAARPGEECTDLRRQVVMLPGQLTAELRALGRGANASVFVLLLTAFNALLALWSGGADTVTGTLAANRPTADSARLLGAHYNVLLLRTDLGDDPSLAECLLRTGASTVPALDHQALPFAVLAGRLERELGWATAAVPGAMLLTDRYPLERLALEGCRVSGLYLDDGIGTTPLDGGGPVAVIPAATVSDLTFFAREAGEHLTISALYPGASLADDCVIAALRAFVEILVAMCESPELPLSELPLSELPPAGCGPGWPTAAPAASPSRPVLREITRMSPVDALSPAGRWAPGPAPAGT